jgi:hypothetical protein
MEARIVALSSLFMTHCFRCLIVSYYLDAVVESLRFGCLFLGVDPGDKAS